MRKKRLFSIVLTLFIVLMLMPCVAFADEGDVDYRYCDENGANWQTGTKKTGEYTLAAEGCTTWGTSGQTTWYVVKDTITINNRVTVNGDVHLILTDGCNLTINGGISVNDSNSLTIYGQENGTGKLIADAGANEGVNNAAGIGGDSNQHSGNIIINGGTVIATGNNEGTGIGGGSWSAFESITINGGTVTATGGKSNWSTGIGAHYYEVTLDSITISGGTVMASGSLCGIFASSHGTISTGNDGHAVIFASHTGEYGSAFHMKDVNESKASWRGVIFEGNSGQVYGAAVTPSESFSIPVGKTLTIDSGKALTIPAGKTLAINEGGMLINNGTIYVDGTFTGKTDSSSTGSVYYLLTLEGAEATGEIFNNHDNGKIYAKSGSEITLTPDTPQSGYLFDKWEVSQESVTIDEYNSLTMPSASLTVTAKWIECKHNGDKEIRNAKAATCTEKGYSGDTYCKVCKKELSKGTATNMLDHKLDYIPKTDATVTEPGNEEYWQCNNCGKYFADENGTNEISLADTVIQKLTPETNGDKGQSTKTDAEASAKTGDNTNLALWIALMLLSGAGIIGACLYSRRKRTN